MVKEPIQVLVLDDDRDDLFYIERMIKELSGLNYRLDTCTSRENAVEKISETKYDILVCDYDLGGENGIDLIRYLRDTGFDSSIILLTGLPDKYIDNEALLAGANNYINKASLSPEVMDRAFRYALSNVNKQKIYGNALFNVEAAICVLDDVNKPIIWNPKFINITEVLYHGLPLESAIHNTVKQISRSNNHLNVENNTFEVNFSKLEDGRTVISLNDITKHLEIIKEREASNKKSEYISHHCSLTKLANRLGFKKEISRLIEEKTPFRLLTIDLDKFKEVNDYFGHGVGDEYLIEIADRLISCCSDQDFLARVGGDEFIAIEKNTDDQIFGLNALAQKFCDAINEELYIASHKFAPSISIGTADYPQHGSTYQKLLAHSDIAMYRAKLEIGSSIQQFNNEIHNDIIKRRELVEQLKHAVSNDEISIKYQPQLDLQSGAIIGFEALARWDNPKSGEIAPSVFIPLAENSGLIEEIGEHILQKACTEALNWPKNITLAVNVSGYQIRHTEFVASVRSILLQTGFQAKRLELELTESVLIEDLDKAMLVLRGIKNMGINLVMDDFGTGYSSLSSLIALPFDKLKIDKSFVSDLHLKNHLKSVVKTCIGLGKSLSLKTVAEGVECPIHLETLKNNGCDSVQGFLISRPIPSCDVTSFIENYDRKFNLDLERCIEQSKARVA